MTDASSTPCTAGLDFDEGPYFQSQPESLNRYWTKLLETGAAYYCSCTPESGRDREGRRRRPQAKYNEMPRADLGPAPACGPLKTPDGKVVLTTSSSPIAWNVQEMDDFVIRRPTLGHLPDAVVCGRRQMA